MKCPIFWTLTTYQPIFKLTPLIKGETWVLSDFGLCEFLNSDEHCDITGENEKVGPIFWMSPEAVKKYYFGINEIGTYSDVYQMGMIFAFVLMKRFPGGILETGNFTNADGLWKILF